MFEDGNIIEGVSVIASHANSKKLLAFSVVVFVASLTQNGYSDSLVCTTCPSDNSAPAFWLFLIGWMGLMVGTVAWLANPILGLSWYFAVRCSRWYEACLCSLASQLLALSFLTHKSLSGGWANQTHYITSYGIGYWLWIGSISISLIGCIVALRQPSKM
jgi:hypothetical protein